MELHVLLESQIHRWYEEAELRFQREGDVEGQVLQSCARELRELLSDWRGGLPRREPRSG